MAALAALREDSRTHSLRWDTHHCCTEEEHVGGAEVHADGPSGLNHSLRSSGSHPWTDLRLRSTA